MEIIGKVIRIFNEGGKEGGAIYHWPPVRLASAFAYGYDAALAFAIPRQFASPPSLPTGAS
jgi:hypothetical protein